MIIKFKTTSYEQTERFGQKLASSLKEGDIIAMDGDLGAGKTCMTRGIARGLGVTSHVSSPTFTIVNEYEGGRLRMFHFDTYRLEGEDDFIASGLDEYFGKGVCVIEWSEVIASLLPNAIKIRITGSGDVRLIEAETRNAVRAGAITEAVRKAGLELI
ncbi:MAG: tRNA (adenosine(37)-N6)-threonylcarbamoyltransferase complex ATPase subunit type 1 TsaE [Saccharofermentans sp.]|nr:tRNA (adenosine(37)-N6)-threonylcarbamoyltransferase complex ATPase subunit type 1 TsaE [Saccharofermentans sp.]